MRTSVGDGDRRRASGLGMRNSNANVRGPPPFPPHPSPFGGKVPSALLGLRTVGVALSPQPWDQAGMDPCLWQSPFLQSFNPGASSGCQARARCCKWLPLCLHCGPDSYGRAAQPSWPAGPPQTLSPSTGQFPVEHSRNCPLYPCLLHNPRPPTGIASVWFTATLPAWCRAQKK